MPRKAGPLHACRPKRPHPSPCRAILCLLHRSLGYGACVSLAVLDEGGQLAVERQVHTGGTGGGQRPGGGAVRSAAGRSRLRAASRPA